MTRLQLRKATWSSEKQQLTVYTIIFRNVAVVNCAYFDSKVLTEPVPKISSETPFQKENEYFCCSFPRGYWQWWYCACINTGYSSFQLIQKPFLYKLPNFADDLGVCISEEWFARFAVQFLAMAATLSVLSWRRQKTALAVESPSQAKLAIELSA